MSSYTDRLNKINKEVQIKAGRFKNTPRKPVDIANQDRPYSASDIMQIQSASTSIAIAKDTKTNDEHRHPEGDTKEVQREDKGDTTKTENPIIIIEKETKEEGDTKGTQRDYIEGDTKEAQKGYKGDTKGTPKGTHKGLQREHKYIDQNTHIKGLQREHKYSHLRGWNKKIVDLIHDICRETVSKVTYPLTNNTISEMLNMPHHSVKTTMQRLKSKGHVIVTEFNDGRGGWSQYTLPEEFFNGIPQTERVLKSTEKGTQRDYKGDTKGNTQGNTNSSCSSSIKYLKTTTTGIDDEWNFDITPYAQFGFTKTQIKQLAGSGVISAADVDQSLIEFSYDLDNNALPLIKTTKINFLMGLLWKGQSYVSEGFKNEQEATISEMARRAESKRKNLLEAKFGVWEGALNDEERKKVLAKLPLHLKVLEKTYGISNQEVRKWYFDYFMTQKID